MTISRYFTESVLVTVIFRGRSRAAATSKMERFVIIVNGQPLTFITKRSILDVAAALDPSLVLLTSSCKWLNLVVFLSKITFDLNF